MANEVFIAGTWSASIAPVRRGRRGGQGETMKSGVGPRRRTREAVAMSNSRSSGLKVHKGDRKTGVIV